jgi:hypothetical protein
LSGIYKKLKEKLILFIDEIDLKATLRPRSAAEREAKKRPMLL